MYTLRGLARDPFAPVCDGPLFWESPVRGGVRRTAEELVRSGKSVWISGAPGSGRAAVLSRIADEVAHEGRRVLWIEPEENLSAEGFLRKLLLVVSGDVPTTGLLSSAEALYRGILEGFYAAGAVVCFPGLEEPTVGSLAEAAILARFRVAGYPIVSLALSGNGDPPFSGLERVSLPPPTPSDLEAFLLHRSAVCGNASALPLGDIREIAASSKGFGDALGKARLALARAVFLTDTASGAGRRPDAAESGDQRASVLDPAVLDELSGLLDSLSPGR